MANNTRQLRSFGLIVGAGFALIGLIPLLYARGTIRVWALALAAVLVGCGVVAPRFLAPAYRLWMKLAEMLAWVNTRVILLAVYYAVIVPIGALMRAAGKDPLRLKFPAQDTTYRVVKTKRAPTHMFRQY